MEVLEWNRPIGDCLHFIRIDSDTSIRNNVTKIFDRFCCKVTVFYKTIDDRAVFALLVEHAGCDQIVIVSK